MLLPGKDSLSKEEPVVNIAEKKLLSVLAVDDDDSSRDLVQRWVVSMGYQCQTVESDNIAAQCFQQSQFDPAMPNMAWKDMAIEMIKIRPNIPIILSTGFIDSRTVQHVKDIDVREIISKPVSPYELTMVIRQDIQENFS